MFTRAQLICFKLNFWGKTLMLFQERLSFLSKAKATYVTLLRVRLEKPYHEFTLVRIWTILHNGTTFGHKSTQIMWVNLTFTKHTRTNLTFFQYLVQLFQWRNPYNSIALSVPPFNPHSVDAMSIMKQNFIAFKKNHDFWNSNFHCSHMNKA